MHELDRLLQELVSQAQSYPKNTDPERRKIIQELWNIMFPGSSLRRYQKPKDEETSTSIYNEAKRRLVGLKKWCRDKHGAMLASDFEQNWDDVMGDVQEEILTKIDIYNRGVDFQLFKEWQKFCQTSQAQQNPEFFSEFCQQVEKFRTRFQNRRTKKKDGIITKPYPPEKSQRLAQICELFCSHIQKQEVDIQQSWNTFCDEVQQLYHPLKFWNWFAFYVKSRFIDLIRQRVKEISIDVPPAESGDNQRPSYAKQVMIFAFHIRLQIWLHKISLLIEKYQKRLDQIQARADLRLSQEAIRIIYQDPDGIFRGKHIRNFPDVNFRAIAILKFKEASLTEINEHFGNRVNAQTTISPFYTRTCSYFKPIIEEYLEAKLALPQSAIEQIVTDSEGKYNRRIMPDRPQITFKVIIQSRWDGVQSWIILARQLQVNVTELIYFYLDSISHFQLIPKPQKRTRRNKNNTEE
jgi:hypothetical protein